MPYLSSFLPLLTCLTISLCENTKASNPGPGNAASFCPIQAVDADDHTIILNKLGMLSVVIGTHPDSQDAARKVSNALRPFQGQPRFRSIVLVDLRDSIGKWVPSIVIARMRKSLDSEAENLRPYYLANGNHENPRSYCYVVPDFNGTVFPQIKWGGRMDQLHAVIYSDGKELCRWDNLDDLPKFQSIISSALTRL